MGRRIRSMPRWTGRRLRLGRPPCHSPTAGIGGVEPHYDDYGERLHLLHPFDHSGSGTAIQNWNKESFATPPPPPPAVIVRVTGDEGAAGLRAQAIECQVTNLADIQAAAAQ
jgi:hypothetical protein